MSARHRYKSRTLFAAFARFGATICAGLLLLGAMELHAELPRLTEVNGLTLMFKAMTFDHAFADRTGEQVVLVILYQERFRESRESKDALVDALRAPQFTQIAGRPLEVHTLTMDRNSFWNDDVLKLDADLLLVTPLRGQPLSAICELAQTHSIGTMTMVPEYVEEGIALSVTVENDRPKLMINLKTSRAEGSDFSAQLLKIARIIE